MIPKKIYSTYSSWHRLDVELRDNFNNWKIINKSWECIFFDDNQIRQFIIENYPYRYLKFFDLIDPHYGACRADLFRYLVLFKTGGVYLDTKAKVKIPFDHWIREDDEYILCQWSKEHLSKYPGAGQHHEIKHVKGGEYINWFLASCPEHPFLKNTIDEIFENLNKYNPFIFGVGKGAVLRTTGPIAYTLAVNKTINRYRFRFIRNLDEYGVYYSIREGSAHKQLFSEHYSESENTILKVNIIITVLYKLNKKIIYFLKKISFIK